MTNFVYNKQKKRWYRKDGSEVKLGNRILGSNGNYYQLNSDGTTTKIGSVSGGLDKSYIDWKKKHKQAINSTLENNAMRSGLIKDKVGKWRLNSTDRNTKTKQVNGKSYFLSKDGVWRNFDTGLKISEQTKQDLSAKNKALTKLKYGNSDESTWDKIKNHGLVDGAIDAGLDWAGVDKNSNIRAVAGLASNGLYLIPGVGTALGLADAGLAAARGDWANAALYLGMGLIPMTRGLKSLKTINKALGSNKVGLREKVASKILHQPALTKSQKMLNELRQVNPVMDSHYAATQYLKNARNPLSKLQLPGGHTINIGEKTAKGLEFVTNWKPNLALGGYTVGRDLYNNIINGIQYETQQQNAQNKQLQQDMNSGVLYGRMSNQDYNSMIERELGIKNTIDQDSYNTAREAYAQGYY